MITDLPIPSHRALALLGLTPSLFRVACAQWQSGCPVFGLWAARHVKPWSARSYGELIVLVRGSLGDTTDYSGDVLAALADTDEVR